MAMVRAKRPVKVALLLSVSVIGLMYASGAFAVDTLTFESQQQGDGTNLETLSRDGSTAIGTVQTGGNSVAYRWVGGTLVTLGTLGGSDSIPFGVSNDGLVVVGYSSTSTGDLHAFRWVGGTMTDLGTLGGTFSLASAVSGDGLVVVGQSDLAGGTATHAFRWVGGTMTDLGTLGGTNSAAHNLSGDGSVVVGESDTPTAHHAFRWMGGSMTDLGTLGGDFSAAYYVSQDGSAIAGASNLVASGPTHAFRYTGTTMTDLGTLGGNFSSPNAISADGSTVVGYSSTATGALHAFRSVNSAAMADLGTLGGPSCANCTSIANAVSGDGRVTVGQSQTTAASAFEATRWIDNGGIQSIPQVLTTAGVDLSHYQLTNANSVSSDGTVIGGNGTKDGKAVAWIVRASTTPGGGGGGTGVTTVDEQTESVASVGKVGQTSHLAMTDSLSGASQSATQGAGSSLQPGQFAVTVEGKFNTEPVASATMGMLHKLQNGFLLGAFGTALRTETPMPLAPTTYFHGGLGTLLVGQVPDLGWQWLVAASGMTARGTINRGYPNGGGSAFSSGNTIVTGFGATGRIGYSFDVLSQVKLTPFGSYTFDSITYDGYTETTGIFTATIAGYTNRSQASRLGLDARYTFAPKRWVWASVDWGHSFSGNQTASMSALVLGAIPITSPGLQSMVNWVDATVGTKWSISNNLSLGGAFTLVRPFNSFPYYIASVGLSASF